MKPKRPLNVGVVGLKKGKVRNDLAALRQAVDDVERLLDTETFRKLPFSALAIIIFYGEETDLRPKFKGIDGEFLDVEIGLNMKQLQDASKESALKDVFVWALLKTLKGIFQKYAVEAEGLGRKLDEYKEIEGRWYQQRLG